MTSQSSVARLEPDRGSELDRCLVTLDAMLVDELGANSLSIIELALSFEETFGIDVADDDVGRLCTASDAVRYARRALSRGGNEFKAIEGS